MFCQRLSIAVPFLFACLVSSWAAAEGYCEGCGCKGGPGYRGPNGQCVGWKRLNKVCGTPPTTRCTAEGPALLVDRKLGIAGAGDANVAGAPVTSNQTRTMADGVGCIETESLQSWQSCSGEVCEADRRQLLDDGACFVIPSGAAVTIEASSRSFDWLRVRVPGIRSPVWTDRPLLLGR